MTIVCQQCGFPVCGHLNSPTAFFFLGLEAGLSELADTSDPVCKVVEEKDTGQPHSTTLETSGITARDPC